MAKNRKIKLLDYISNGLLVGVVTLMVIGLLAVLYLELGLGDWFGQPSVVC